MAGLIEGGICVYRQHQQALDWIERGNNEYCFSERQQALAGTEGLPYPRVLERVLGALSPVIRDWDLLAGGMVEGPWDGQGEINPQNLEARGHIVLDYASLLRLGLEGMMEELRETAQGRDEGAAFLRDTEACVAAVTELASRYAQQARALAAGAEPLRRGELVRMAEALDRVPSGPAQTFYEALQSIWFVHHVFSCAIGSRDYAFPLLDRLLLPYYEADLAAGCLDRQGALDLLIAFFVKCKSITGTNTDNYHSKPVPCFASNQYVTIGGKLPDGSWNVNALTALILQAARESGVPQPEINVRIGVDAPAQFKRDVAETMLVCGHKVQLWNEEVMLRCLRELYPGIAAEDVPNYCFTACNRIALPPREAAFYTGTELWFVLPQLMLEALPPRADSFEEVVAAVERAIAADTARQCRGWTERTREQPPAYHFESLFVSGCRQRLRDVTDDGPEYNTLYFLFGGLATVVDSLCAIDYLVFRERRIGYAALLEAVRGNFAGQEELRQQLLHRPPKYGNGDPAADALTARLSRFILDGARTLTPEDGYLKFPAIYTLYNQVSWGAQLGATPDGRRAGEPISENESPVRGMDTHGLTALLRSLSVSAQDRSPMGGLNLTFGGAMPPEDFIAMMDGFFALGGRHFGYTQVTRRQLEEAEADPEAHRSLCVRVTGFSEYFVALSPESRRDVMARTAY